MERCPWCTDDPLYIRYHDKEWGVPVHDDRTLFEFLVLEGAQAGLSWITILRKREDYRKAFDRFDIPTVASYGPQDVERLLADPGIVRNRRKIEAAIGNAERVIEIQREAGSFDRFLWQYVQGTPIQNRWASLDQVPASTTLSETLAKDLKRRGFRFVGPAICYAFMQATGMVNDHTLGCFRHAEVQALQNR
jgi:DNA-3-methyladenine glycosylase I